MSVFLFYVKRKLASLKREALKFSPFNRFIVGSVIALYISRVLGALFTFSNAVISVLEFYNTPGYRTYRILMADVIFPIRDMVEALFFAYLFYFQSKRVPINLSQLNEDY
jgi:hypothetical protein